MSTSKAISLWLDLATGVKEIKREQLEVPVHRVRKGDLLYGSDKVISKRSTEHFIFIKVEHKTGGFSCREERRHKKGTKVKVVRISIVKAR